MFKFIVDVVMLVVVDAPVVVVDAPVVVVDTPVVVVDTPAVVANYLKDSFANGSIV